MEFFKKIFNDDSVIVGLCAFGMKKPNYVQSPIEHDFFFNPFQEKQTFQTNFSKNNLLL